MTTNIDNLLLQASRQKWRFDTPKGALAIEDLWDLPLTSGTGKANLDDIAKSLFRKAKADNDEPTSFVTASAKPADVVTPLKLEVVKYVIDVISTERTAAANAAARAAQRQLVMKAIDDKKANAINDMSVEDLQALLESLK
jgi:hypothetical protein